MPLHHQTSINTFIDYQHNNLYQFLPDLTLCYNNLFEKFNEYFLFFTIIISIMTIFIILSIIFESNILLNFLLFIYSFHKYLYIKLKKKFLQLTTSSSSLLNFLLNSPNYIQKLFLNEFLHSLNQKFLYKKEQLQIEKLQFTDAKIYHISQKSNEPPVINATLNIDNLVFNILNPIKKHHYSIEIPKLTGELQIYLINNIEVKFKQIQINSVDIIDSKNILSSDEKQSIIKLLTEIISQTIVQFCFHLPDKQDKIVNEPKAPPPTPLTPLESCEIPILTPAKTNNQQISLPQEPRKLLVRIVKAVKLHDVEQPFCLLQLNHPKQTHQTSIAKNGLNPFWDERFVFECNDKSNEIHLKIFDRKKPNKKLPSTTNDILYADVSIPFSYVTSTIYKQDVRMTPQYPESMIRIEFSTLSEEETLIQTNKYEHSPQQSPSEDISILSHNTSVLPRDYPNGSNALNNTFNSHRITADIFPTPSDNISQAIKSHKTRSILSSIRNFSFRRKKYSIKGKQDDNGVISSPNSVTQTNNISHSASAEPFLYSNTTGPILYHQHHSVGQSFKNIFRSKSKKKPIRTDNFIIDHPDLLSPSPMPRKKHSLFQRFTSKRKKQQINSSANSLTSYDCTRAESVQNTPIRANGGRPVTMTKPLVQ